MKEGITIGPGQNSIGMGDVLILTAICKHVPDCTIELPHEVERFSRFFRGISKNVVLKDSPAIHPLSEGKGHHAECRLRALGLEGECYLPHVDITEEEAERGAALISSYKNPIVFKPNCAALHKGVKEFSREMWQDIIDELAEDHSLLQFGISSHFTEFDNVTNLIDVSIDDLICYYSAIKKYVGVDTGDVHLMLACGGSVHVYHPPTNPSFDLVRWRYEYPNAKYTEVKK
jgi:hypothetical protein